MKKLFKVKNLNGDELQRVIFEKEESMQDFQDLLAKDSAWGKATYDEVIPAPLDPETGEKIGEDEIIHHAAEYEIEITDYIEPIADISPRQIRLALLASGITELAVDSVIDGLSSPSKEQAMIAWKFSTTFQRNVPIIESLGAVLGLSPEQLDDLWKLGITL